MRTSVPIRGRIVVHTWKTLFRTLGVWYRATIWRQVVVPSRAGSGWVLVIL